MAESAVHITSSLLNNPSIFELIAQESLSNLFYPSFKIVVQFIGSTPRYQWINEWNEEVFLIINSFLQLHYLNIKGASFSESFYGLRRVSNKAEESLSVKTKTWSIFCLVCLPYLARKVEKASAKLKNHKVDLCRRTVVAGWQGLSLIQYLLYLTGRTSAHCPLLSVANLSLQYGPEPTDTPKTWKQCFSSGRECLQLCGQCLGQSLQLTAFFLQCMQWWHSDSAVHRTSPTAVPPPPPQVTGLEKTSEVICPICKEHCRIETALQTSGYVFCYRCIREEVSTNQKCPVTSLPATLDELVRLYPTNNK